MRRAILAFLGVVLAVLACTPSAFAAKRVALVIGINDYPKLKTPDDPELMQLDKAVADAETMAGVLEGLGFDVELALNADRTAFLTALDNTKRKIAPGDTVFVFYSGHGIALKGSNLLLPSDFPPVAPDAENLMRGLAIAETDIIEAVREKSAGLIVLALDACRNNPVEDFARRQARIQGRKFRSLGTMRSVGLEVRPTSGVFSIYSAGIGQFAIDGLGPDDKDPNSVFTRVFAKKLKEPGRDLPDIMEDVKESVASLAATVKNPRTRAAHKQFAAYYNETQGGRIYLAGRPKAGDAALVLQAADPALAAWNAAKDTESVSVLEAFIARFGDSFYAALAKAKLAELKKKEAETEVAVGVFPKSEAEAEKIYRSPGSFVAGNPDGDVSVVEFFDYNCGYCRRALPDVVKLIDTDDKVRVVLKELAIFGEDSEAAARAALAANKQGKYFEMHQKLFSEPGKANKEKALQIAQELGMDVEQLEQDMEDPEIQKTLDETLALAGKLGLKGTPYYLIGDRSLPGAPDDLYDQLTKKIAEVREKGCQTMC